MSRRRRRTKGSVPTAADAEPLGSTASDHGQTTEPKAAEPPEPGPPQSILNIKVDAKADVASTLERLQRVDGFRAIEPLFPGETHPDLSTIYVAHVDSDRLATALPEIEADEDIEYVEEPPSRKLVR